MSVQCPYNPQHVMPRERLAWHLTMVCKDMKKLSHLFSICPYNRTHHMKTPKLDEHVKTCPDRPSEEKKEEMKELARQLGEPDDAWEASWPEERKNLNAEYIPAAVKPRPVRSNNLAGPDVNQPPPQPVANPYLLAPAPAVAPAVQSEADEWETVETRRRQKPPPGFSANPGPEETLGQIQAKAIGKKDRRRRG